MTPEFSMLRRSRKPLAAFTLIELLVSITFLVILMLVVTQVIAIVQRSWVRANSRVSQFREARRAFDVISRNLGQATLNTYWANDFTELDQDKLGAKVTAPTSYLRKSELQFVCGPTSTILPGASGPNFPGHAVFFQAPLGVVRLVPATTGQADTANLVNLLCGRGYFVQWGSDAAYRPSFLSASPYSETVPTRSRLRLMEYSPTAEMNRIYDAEYRPITDPGKSRQWYQNTINGVLAVASQVQDDESQITRAFTRPIAENILALIISPQLETPLSGAGGTVTPDTTIAPNYLYDSVLPGPTASGAAPQGTQHLLPPLLKVTMIAMDERSGEFLSSTANSAVLANIMSGLGSLFSSASNFTADLEGTPDSPGTLEQLLLDNKINYRVFTTTIALKQARWSF